MIDLCLIIEERLQMQANHFQIFVLPKTSPFHYYRRMTSTTSMPIVQKLVSKISIAEPTMPHYLKQTNFARQNRSMYIHCRPYPQFRFQKHRNVVQSNKENMTKVHNQTLKPCVPNLKNKTHNNHSFTAETAFTPKRQIDIRSKHPRPQPDPNTQTIPSNLQSLLLKHKMKGQRNLIGFNIIDLQERYNYSRFELYTLYSIYSTLLMDCKHSLRRFKESFEVMLNMNRIALRPQVLQKILIETETVSFEGFIEMYSRIDQVIFKQSIIDYVQILFEGVYYKNNIRFQDIVRILRERTTEKEAVDLATAIFQQCGRPFEETIRLCEVSELCNLCENFAKKMYRLYTSEMRCE